MRWFSTQVRHTLYFVSSIQVWSPATNFQLLSQRSGFILASSGLASATCFSKRASRSFLLVGSGEFIDGAQASLFPLSVGVAQSPVVSATWPASLPRVIDLGCGFHEKSALSGIASNILRVVAVSRSYSAISSF